jgi:hypothetical protein
MDQEIAFGLRNAMNAINERLQELAQETEELTKKYNQLLEEWAIQQPYFKIEYIAEDADGEYTFGSGGGDFRFDLQHYVDKAKAKLKFFSRRRPVFKQRTQITKAYVWENIPYEDIEKELIGLYEPAVVIILKDI